MYANVTEHVLPHWFRAAFSVHAHIANLKHPHTRSGTDRGLLLPAIRGDGCIPVLPAQNTSCCWAFHWEKLSFGGQASNALPLRLELLHAMKVTASAADILQWKTGAGPPAHKWTGKHTLLNCKTVITFGKEKDLKTTLLKSVMFPPFDDLY